MRVIGLMSGTSYDAIDAAAADLRLDGDKLVLTPLGMLSQPYPDELRASIAGSLPPASTSMEDVCRLDTGIGQAFAEVARQAVEQLCGGYADLIVSHGQTVFHWVDAGEVRGTLQLGQPAWIAEATGTTVVSDLRARDVAAGGQGAPLVSIIDVLWLRGRPGVPIALNLGGIANITVVHGEPVAFDTGPANALIDAVVNELTAAGRSTRTGRWPARAGARGAVRPVAGRAVLRPAGAEEYGQGAVQPLLPRPGARGPVGDPGRRPGRDGDGADGRTVADAVRRYGGTEVIASGGGIRNPVLMRRWRRSSGRCRCAVPTSWGLPSAAKEAYAFAVLGFLTVNGLGGTVPSCTGARHTSVLGSITPGAAGLPDVASDARPPVSLTIA